MFANKLRNDLYLLFFVILLFTSCIDEYYKDTPKEEYITITGINTRAYEGAYPGDGLDDKVETLRILAFNKTSRACESNTFYSGDVLNGNTFRHPINIGEYDFIFLANEPHNTVVKAALDNIADYDAIKSISYPARYFDSELIIPMIAENNGVKVLLDGKLEVNGSAKTELTVGLRRLAARVDVVLKSKVNFGDGSSGEFKGITFSNIPDRVPLVYGLPSDYLSGSWEYGDPTLAYSGGTAIDRTVERKLTLVDNPDCFKIDPALLTTEDKANDLVWAVKVKKVILPSSFFSTKTDEANAIDFTVNLIDKYNPSCKLKIVSNPVNYTLPANAKLDLTGLIREPLEVNIQPSPWIPDGGDWDISGIRILNVSHVKAKMTDMNGVRISFSSNMPVVKVLDTVQKEGEANERVTNTVFNCLAVDANNPDPYRFVYDPTTGSGHMDLLVDGTNTTGFGTHDRTENMSGTYTLTLFAAEDANGRNALQRKIKVTVTQEGLRFVHNPTANLHGLFNAAFFGYNQKGERIITGQHRLDQTWSVTVPDVYRSWLVVSATPSFDPNIGTESPGDAEDYPVVPNQYRGENGTSIAGLTGRIYFRIGVKEDADFVPTKESEPKFGYINLSYYPGWRATMRIYVRQGEAGAYIYEPSDAIPGTVYGAWNGNTDISADVREDMRLLPTNTRRGAAKFSALNLTSANLAGNTDPAYENVGVNGARFVDFPSQAGAFFQWGVDLKGTVSGMTDYYRRAYNPSKSYLMSGFPWGYQEFPIMWDGDTNADIPVYKSQFEVCPPGYRRPTDGFTDQISYNGYYDYLPDEGSTSTATNYKDQVEYSELRVSLFNVPFAGNAASSADYLTTFTTPFGGTGNTGPGTYPYGIDKNMRARKQLKGTTYTFYSDGFFDRRPVKDATNGNYGVSIGNSKVAYQGVLYFNPDTHRSVFFPSAGRLNNTSGALESIGSTGYYWSSSAGPPYTRSELQKPPYDRRIRYGAWTLESAYNSHNFRLAYQGFAQSIRCVKE